MATTSNKLLKAVKKHPVGTAAIVGGAVAGAVLVGKAAKTAARLVTIKVAADAASDVAKAVRGPAKSKTALFGGKGSPRKTAKKKRS